MKLPIAGQSSSTENRHFEPRYLLMRSLVLVADPGISPWPALEGVSVPVFRLAEAQKFSERVISSPVPHHELMGSAEEIASHLQGQKCVILGDWAASWAQTACRVWLTNTGIRGSSKARVPWDLVVSPPRPRLVHTLLQRIL